MATINLTEFRGTSTHDIGLANGAYTITYGLGGDDRIGTSSRAPYTIVSGGIGNDVYLNEGWALIADVGGGYDILSMPGISFSSPTSYVATIEGRRHLALWDDRTGTQTIILDWLSPANKIEELQFGDVVISSDELAHLMSQNPSYVLDYSWNELYARGVSAYSASVLDETYWKYINNSVYYTFQAEAQGIGRLYEAGLNRTPDLAGLNFWYDVYTSGVSKVDIAREFIKSAEFKAAFGDAYGQSAYSYVDVLYRNVLGRQSDSAGAAYWEGLINSGVLSREEVLISISDSRENINQSAYLDKLSDLDGDGWWTFA